MNLLEMRNLVAARRGDAGFDRWDQDQTDDDINQGILAFCDEVPLLRRVTLFTPAMDSTDAGEYSPENGGELDELHSLQTGRLSLRVRTPDQLFAWDTNWLTRTGTPQFVVPDYRPGVVLLVPKPTAVLTDLYGDVTLLHPELTAPGEEPSFSRAFHMAPVYWALAEGYGGEEDENTDVQKERYYRSRYREVVKRAKAKTARKFNRSAEDMRVRPAR